MITALCENDYHARSGKEFTCEGTVRYLVEHPAEPKVRFSNTAEPCRCDCHGDR